MDAKQRLELESQLSAYIDGELTDTERAEVEAFLADDAQARQVLAELRATVAGLHSLPRAKTSGDLMADMRSRLERQALLGNAPTAGMTPPATTSFGGRWIAAAAVIALAVVAGSVMWTFKNQDTHRGREQFAMHKSTEAPPRAENVQEERQERSPDETLLADKSKAPSEDKDKSQIPVAAPPMLLADADQENEKGRPLAPVKKTLKTKPAAPEKIAQAPSAKLLAEQPESEGRRKEQSVVIGTAKDVEPVKASEPTVVIATGKATPPADDDLMVVRQELKPLHTPRRVTFKTQTATQPQFASQPQEPADFGRYLANRPVSLPTQSRHKADRLVFDLGQRSATQPTTHPVTKPAATRPYRPIGTQPAATQPALSTRPALQTRPAHAITQSRPAAKPQTTPSRE